MFCNSHFVLQYPVNDINIESLSLPCFPSQATGIDSFLTTLQLSIFSHVQVYP